MTYLVDANVFMQANNLHYGLDFCPAFWDWLRHKNHHGELYSIDKVADEIAAGADDLSDWVQDYGDGLFKRTTPQIAMQFGAISQWVTEQNYDPAAINTFLQVADFYLIAHALAENHVLVTHEVPANSTKRIKIPNVCIGLDIHYMTPYEMLRRERARFVLGGQ